MGDIVYSKKNEKQIASTFPQYSITQHLKEILVICVSLHQLKDYLTF